jgi:chemotaxis methyl-accepting protein methylase
MTQANLKNIKEIRDKHSDIMNFTGRGRDIQQFIALAEIVNDNCSFLFIGCSTGDEILDCQDILKAKHPNKKFTFLGVDADLNAVSIARKKQYFYNTTIEKVDFLESNYSERHHIIVCRNMLIYYDDKHVNSLIEKIMLLSKQAFMLGLSDPITFTVNESNIIDFDNRIFKSNNRG